MKLHKRILHNIYEINGVTLDETTFYEMTIHKMTLDYLKIDRIAFFGMPLG
jgi:hypothetical protein